MMSLIVYMITWLINHVANIVCYLIFLHGKNKKTARNSKGGKAPKKQLAKKAPRISAPATASLSGKGHCLVNTLNWLYPNARYTSIHLDACIDTRLITDPFDPSYAHSLHEPVNSTGGNGGFYIHTVRTLFAKDNRLCSVKIYNVLTELKGLNNPSKLIKLITKSYAREDKFILADTRLIKDPFDP
ncbi:hypothetical protein BC833DRAFT_570735 [Globomyces pollinis-pini]|nr:hypothetical protein BC833DRAFT_570735 [Globomyces pollinis-pini]